MQMPIEVKARGLEITDFLEAEIQERAARLERFYERIVRVRVTVEGPGRHHRAGNHRVRIDLTVPGSEIVINRQAGETVGEALREAFDAAGRRLEDHVRKTRGYVKRHAELPRGRVLKVFPELGYGILEDEEGRKISFQEESVRHVPFDRLAPGTEVRFSEEAGEEGPQAATVTIAGL